MQKNPNYLYGSTEINVPAKLHFGEFILSKLWENKERIATINGETQETHTYKEMAEEAMNVAVSLVRMGVRKGDVVAVCTENRREFWGTAIAIICSGAVLSPINMGYTKEELKHVMAISKPKYVICSPRAYNAHSKTFSTLKHIRKVIIYGDEKPNDVILYNYLAYAKSGGNIYVSYDEFEAVDVRTADDLLFILYSSGTTGLPKGVMLTHLNLLTMSLQPEDNSKDSKVLVITPWHHAMGLVGCFSYLTAGRTVIYMPRFEPGLYLDTIEKHKVQQITSVPPILITLSKYQSNHDLSSIRLIYCGAAPLKTETINAVVAKFPNADTVRQGYGMTESTLAICKSLVTDKAKVGSVGTVVKTTTLKIVDIETRKPLGKFQDGEICVKGPLIMKGYIGKDRKEDFDGEGFYRTGDIGYYDEEGYVFIVGRLKELIKYKGHQVAPAEIEAVLLQHEGIRDAGVIGVADDDAGEVPLAFVVLQPGAILTEDDVKKFVAEKLSNPKRLRGGVRFVPEIPKNPSGKILRNRLKKMLKASKSKL